ncbi:MAG: hypothetical protein OHK0052_21630 [Anaerolineales bacterium]
MLTLALVGCRSTSAATPAPFVAPTSIPAASATPDSNLRPTSAANCSNNLQFLEDLTIPDGSRVQPGDRLDKRWQVVNTGECNWNAAYSVRLVAGPALGLAENQPLYPARGGTQAIIRLIFTAPQTAGAYRSAWQAHTPQGEPFGDPFFIDFIVEP